MDEPLILVAFKLPRSLYERLEAHRTAQPYPPSRTGVLRQMVERCLDEAAEQRVAKARAREKVR